MRKASLYSLLILWTTTAAEKLSQKDVRSRSNSSAAGVLFHRDDSSRGRVSSAIKQRKRRQRRLLDEDDDTGQPQRWLVPDLNVQWADGNDGLGTCDTLPAGCTFASTTTITYFYFYGNGHLIRLIPYCIAYGPEEQDYETLTQVGLSLVTGDSCTTCLRKEPQIDTCQGENLVEFSTIPGQLYILALEGDPMELDYYFPFSIVQLGIEEHHQDVDWPSSSPTESPAPTLVPATLDPTKSPTPSPTTKAPTEAPTFDTSVFDANQWCNRDEWGCDCSGYDINTNTGSIGNCALESPDCQKCQGTACLETFTNVVINDDDATIVETCHVFDGGNWNLCTTASLCSLQIGTATDVCCQVDGSASCGVSFCGSSDMGFDLCLLYQHECPRLVETNPDNSDKDTTTTDGGVTYTSSGISIDIEWTADKPCSTLEELPAECARPNNPSGVWYSFLGNAEFIELEPYDCYETIDAVTMLIVAGNHCGMLQCVQPPIRVSLCEGPNDRIRLQTLPGVHYRIYIEHSNLQALEEDLPFTMYQKGIPSDFVEPDPTPAPTGQPTRATPSPTVSPTISLAPTPSPTVTPMPTYPGISLEWPHEMCPQATQQLSEPCGGGNNRQGGVWYSFTGNGQEVRLRPYTTCDPWTQVEMVIVMGSCEKGMLQCVQEEQTVDLCGNGQDILLQTLPGVFYQVWLGGVDPDLLEEDFPFTITQLGIPKDFILPEATPAPTGSPSLATSSPTASPTRTPLPTPSPTSSPRPTYPDRDFEIAWPYDMCDNAQALPEACGGSTSKSQGLWYEFFGTGHLMEFTPYCFEQMTSTKMTIVMGSCDKNRLVCVQEEQVIPLCENNNKDPIPIRLQTIPGVHYQVFLEGDPRKLENDFPFDFDELGIPDTIWPKTPSPTALPTIATPSPTIEPTVLPEPTPSPSSSPRPTYEMRDLEIEWPYEICSNVQNLPDACGGLTLDTQGLWYEFYGNGHLIELQPYDCFEDMAETKMLIVMGSCERNMLQCVMEEQTVALCDGNGESILLQTIPRVHYMIFLQGDPRKLEKDLPFSFKELGVPENPMWPKTPFPTESPTSATPSPTSQPTLSLTPTASPSASPAPTYEMRPLEISWPVKMCANVESLPATCAGNSPDRLGLWYEFWGNGHLIELKPYECFDDMSEIKMTIVQGSCELNRLECVSEEQTIPFCGQQADSILLQTIPRVHYSVLLDGDPTKLKSDFPFSIVELGVPDTKWPFTTAPSAAPTRSQAPTSSTTAVGSTPVPTASETTTDASDNYYDPLLEQDGQTTSDQSVPPLPASSATPCGDDINIPSCPAPLLSGGEWYSIVGTGGPLVLLPICVEMSPGTTVTVMQGDCEDGLVCVLETQSLDAACDFDDESFRRKLAPKSLPNFQSLAGVTYILHVVHGDPSFSGNPLYVLPASGNFALTPTESPTPIGEGDLLTQEDAIAEEEDRDSDDSAKVASTKPPQASPDDETDDTVMIGAVIALALLMLCICCSCAACICVFYKRRREMEEKLVEKKQGNGPRRNNNNIRTEGTAHTRPMTEITGHSRGSWWNSNRDDDIFEGLEDEYEYELKDESQESSTEEVEEDCQSMEEGLARIDIEGMDSMDLSDSSMSVDLKGCDGDSDDEEMDTLSRVTDFSTEISLGTMDEDELTTETDDMQSCGQFSLDTMESQEFLPTYTGQPSLDLLADDSSVSEGDREDEDGPQSPELEKSHMISLGCSELNDSAWVSLGEIGDASDADKNSSESDDDTVEDSASNNENSENESESSGWKSEMSLNDENDDSDGDCDECTSYSDGDECTSYSDGAELEEADESESCSHAKCPPPLDVDDDNTGDDCEDSSCTSEEGGFQTDESERSESSLDMELNHQDAPKRSEVEGIDDGFDDASSTTEEDELESHESESSNKDEWDVSQTGNLNALEAGIEEQEEDEQVVDCDHSEEVKASDYSHAEKDENTEMPITDSQESSRAGEDGGPSRIKEPTDSPTKANCEESHGEIKSSGNESKSSEISDKKGIEHEKEEDAAVDGEGLEEVDEHALLNEEVDLSNFMEEPTVSLADMLYQRRRWD